MSTSARRLSADVVTNRFAWQGGDASDQPSVVSVLRHASATPMASAVRDLPAPAPPPTPVADRIEAAEQAAYAKGYAEGERAGESAAAARLDDLTSRLTATIEEIAELRAGVMRRAERDLVRLAITMAERVLRREVDVDRELLVVMARVAVDRLGESTTATVHLNPVDHDAIAARRTRDLGRSIELVSDPSVVRGGCLVRSPFGTIDVGIESQVRELSRALLGDDTAESEEGADGAVAGA